MKAAAAPTRRKIGRPLSFDPEAALYQAMLLFWRHGYEATALSDLTRAMGVTPPSIYAAFGDKKGLFRAAVRLYLAGPLPGEPAPAESATAREAAWSLLRGAAIRFTGAKTPPGCLVASAAIGCSAAAADIQAELAAVRGAAEQTLSDRIAAGIEAGELPGGSDPDALAAHLMAVIQGMSTLARDGASREKLLSVADTAMRAWPL